MATTKIELTVTDVLKKSERASKPEQPGLSSSIRLEVECIKKNPHVNQTCVNAVCAIFSAVISTS